ncbi:MAG TPA: hypothetical protein VMT11_09990 [Myxococcaceae bacterium]|nr:hypothetical protein [Myxococcaceae bacterium]
MSISGVGSSAVSSPLLVSQQSPSVAGAVSGTTSVSDFASLLDQLQQLSWSDPEKFKQVASTIAQQLQQAAQGATGNRAQFLGDLANRFQHGAQTGTLPSLAPSPSSNGADGAQHNHHHHHLHQYAAQQSSSSPQPTVAEIIQGALQSAS